MSPNCKRFLRDNFSGISLTLIGLLCAAAVTVAYLNRQHQLSHSCWRRTKH